MLDQDRLGRDQAASSGAMQYTRHLYVAEAARLSPVSRRRTFLAGLCCFELVSVSLLISFDAQSLPCDGFTPPHAFQHRRMLVEIDGLVVKTKMAGKFVCPSDHEASDFLQHTGIEAARELLDRL